MTSHELLNKTVSSTTELVKFLLKFTTPVPSSIPESSSVTDGEDSLEQFLRKSDSISEATEILGSGNTPLTARDAGLIDVVNGTGSLDNLQLSHDRTQELAWIIPSVVAVVVVFVILALLFFYGIRTLELKMMKCCYKNCGCCPPSGVGTLNEETTGLTSSIVYENTEMRGTAYHSQSALDPSNV